MPYLDSLSPWREGFPCVQRPEPEVAHCFHQQSDPQICGHAASTTYHHKVGHPSQDQRLESSRHRVGLRSLLACGDIPSGFDPADYVNANHHCVPEGTSAFCRRSSLNCHSFLTQHLPDFYPIVYFVYLDFYLEVITYSYKV